MKTLNEIEHQKITSTATKILEGLVPEIADFHKIWKHVRGKKKNIFFALCIDFLHTLPAYKMGR